VGKTQHCASVHLPDPGRNAGGISVKDIEEVLNNNAERKEASYKCEADEFVIYE